MLRVKDEEYAKGRDYQDGELSEDYSDNELELYQQYCAGKYGEHSTVPASPHFHSTLQSNTKDLFTTLAHLDILVNFRRQEQRLCSWMRNNTNRLFVWCLWMYQITNKTSNWSFLRSC